VERGNYHIASKLLIHPTSKLWFVVGLLLIHEFE
jgi:hypothetical protein